MDKNFNQRLIEDKWCEKWLESHLFQAGKKQDLKKKPYTIIMPPPNVTGVLHNGHALFVTLQDTLARFYRMKGYDVLWLPGTDHAGIATQSVVERELRKNQDKSKYDLGRKDFVKLVFAWKDKHGGEIIRQLKRLGASADWSRFRFTMDDHCSNRVRYAFKKLWDDGLIYRKERLVSWDPKNQTALSNEEVDHKTITGELCYFAYRVRDDERSKIIVATTRLETMLGDTAVAVNPQDERYKHLIGKDLIHPFCESRKLQVIADDYVDKEFGSGAVKITPAHDPNDFEIGRRHHLDSINILNLDGTINEQGKQFSGLNRFVARKKIKEELTKLGLFEKTQTIEHAVTVSQRSGEIIEPMLSKQYFVNAEILAKAAFKAVDEGEVNIFPSYFKKIWDHFLLNIQDWCISRQLWWGHQIPVYYYLPKMKELLEKSNNINEISSDNKTLLKYALENLSDDEVKSFSHVFLEDPKNINDYIQEEDVLDTWFSSGLWPFATLGWPDETDDFLRFYPTAVLETGSDILFFWVARMMMMGIYFTGKPPFKDVFLHSMVRDASGRKMSKSLGNAIDPIDIINGINLDDLIAKTKTYPIPQGDLNKVLSGIEKEYPSGIPSCGADGLRLSLAIFSGEGGDVKFSLPRVLGYRSFLNKVWNASRFCIMNTKQEDLVDLESNLKNTSLGDKYILSKLYYTAKIVDEYLFSYEFSSAAKSIYEFFWQEFCDNYIELAKSTLSGGDEEKKKITKSVILFVLENSLKLLHPFCPFVSEEIYENLPNYDGKYLLEKEFPSIENKFLFSEAEKKVTVILDICKEIRNARQSNNMPANKVLEISILTKEKYMKDAIVEQRDQICHLAKVIIKDKNMDDENCLIVESIAAQIKIKIDDVIDYEKEGERLKREQCKLTKEKEGLIQRLGNKKFKTNAPEAVVENCEIRLKELNLLLEGIEKAIVQNNKRAH